ncbi:hypothetical protein PDESU_06290 [Pontiella desulfatans]|uniref:Uncharacterized protein n=1 Tax=Pontiella desulfatans TaxID=2750659 RepID=A0A6C2UBZ4_PONDE|nr:hypothetical protein [Pontiella desulfatans]VGO17688.1 hypothetical protein PDESU_06290 [Pontiella desulfatans]
MRKVIKWFVLLLVAQNLFAAPAVLEAGRFKLRFAADGKPASFALPDGTELLNVGDPGRGFYLKNASKAVIDLPVVWVRDSNQLIVESENRTQQIIFDLTEGDQYVGLQIRQLKGIPKSSALTLHFEMNAGGNVKALALDFMTPHLDHLKGRIQVDWPFLYHRYKDDPLGGFALYCPTDKTDEDDTLLHMWGELDLPHPAVNGEWDYAAAKKWMKQWLAEFSDQSRMMFEAESLEDLYEGSKYAEAAGLKGIYLMPWVWRGSYWPTDMTNDGINLDVFPDGRKDVAEFSAYLKERGMRLLFHYVSGGIGYNDPVYIGTKPDRRLASWGGGKLVGQIDAAQTTIQFRPDNGVELPYRIPRANVHNFNGLPPAMHFFHNFQMMRIGDEIIKVGSFENTDQEVWTLKNCERGKFTTQAAAHVEGTDASGLIDTYDQNFLPDNNSTLLDEIAGNFAGLLNECGVMNTEYDGGEIHCYEGPSKSIGWGYNKFACKVYTQLDHPVMADSSAERPPECNFEYKFNAVKKLVGPIKGHQYYVALMPEHPSRPATTMLDANFQLSQVAATRSACFGIKTQDRGVRISDLKAHGLAADICKLVAQWKKASDLMTDEQRQAILRKGVRWNDNIWLGDRHTEDDLVQVLKEEDHAFLIVPVKVLTRNNERDVKWCVGQEHGSIAPKQFIRPGDELKLHNPNDEQEMKFVLRVLWETDYEDEANVALAPAATNLQDLNDTQASDEGNALRLKYRNDRAEAVWNGDKLPEWEQTVDLSANRAMGLWVEGDGSGALLLVQLPKRDYVIPVDFKGRRYIEIPHGQAAWAEGLWGWRMATWKHADYNNIHKLNIGFGKVPASTHADISVEGIKALREKDAELVNPVITCGKGRIRIMGTIATGQYLDYKGGDTATVYDRNWNKVEELNVQKQNYSCGNGPVTVSVSADNAARPWMEIQCTTEGSLIRVPKK